jgi:hypothetical protein
LIVSHKHRFIFIKTHKTAGTSVELLLSRVAGPDAIVPPAAPGDDREPTLDDRNWRAGFNPLPELRRTLTTGATVNGPFPKSLGGGFDPPVRSRVSSAARTAYQAARRIRYFDHASAWLLRERLGRQVWDSYFKFCFERNPWDKAVSLYSWRAPTEIDGARFSEWVISDCGQLESDWPLYSIDDDLAVDFVGRFENLTDDLRAALAKVGAPGVDRLTLPTAHTGRRREIPLMTTEAQARIAEIFCREIDRFGYEVPAA